MTHRITNSNRKVAFIAAIVAAIAGCQAPRDDWLTSAVACGEYGRVRAALNDRVGRQPRPRGGRKKLDRTYILNRMGLALVTLADGYGRRGDLVFEELFDVLRTQGINADKTVTSVVINEDVKTWKGEPFEQALAFHYTAVHYAQRGDWGNARAAADNSLFYLRDFGENRPGRRKSQHDILEEAAHDEQYLDHGYRAVESNFALGYMMHGIASTMLGRRPEASDHLSKVAQLNPSLQGVVDRIESGDDNIILIVDYGRGPRKIGTGPDAAIASFVPRTHSDGRRLMVVTGEGGAARPIAAVCDVNTMARDHMWNSLESLRIAKSRLGTALLMAGAAVASHGGHRRNEDATYAGLGLLLGGLLAKAGAHADTRYCDLVPQRVYVVPVQIGDASTTISLEVEGVPSSRMVLTGIAPPPHGRKVLLRYVRLVSSGAAAPSWAESGRIYYANDSTPAAVPSDLPYILGGHCVRPPTDQILKSYQDAGFLRHMSLGQLDELYRLEGIRTLPDTPQAQPTAHLLEGGDSLVAPDAGTAGFARIFGRLHPPYEPQSEPVRELAERLRHRVAAETVVNPHVNHETERISRKETR